MYEAGGDAVQHPSLRGNSPSRASRIILADGALQCYVTRKVVRITRHVAECKARLAKKAC